MKPSGAVAGAGLLILALLLTPRLARAQDAAELYRQGKGAYDAGRYEEALDRFSRANLIEPRPLLLFHIARTLAKRGNEREAIDHYQRYLAAEPRGPGAKEARTQTAALEAALAAKNEAARRKTELDAERRRIDEGDALLQQGYVAATAGDFTLAVKHYLAAYDLLQNPEIIYSIADSYDRFGARTEARAEYERYLALAPAGSYRKQAEARIAALTTTAPRPVVEVAPVAPVATVVPAPQPEPARAAVKPVTEDPPAPPPQPRSKTRYLWLLAGSALIVSGVVVLATSPTATSDEVSANDYVGLGLLVGGGVCIYLYF